MKLLILVACLVAACLAAIDDWETFKAEHGKHYLNIVEERFRKNVFLQNKDKIDEHNKLYKSGEKSYHLKMNRFGDLMTHEFKTLVNGFNKGKTDNTKKINSLDSFVPPINVDISDEVDWRKKGAVTPVKDQGQCGSCWAFSVTGALEGQWFLKTGQLIQISEQNLIDCTTGSDYGNLGCGGGLMDTSFQYIKDNNGIDTESSYPYEAEDGKCRFIFSNVGAVDSGYVDIPSGDENALKLAVATVGPISVAIDAGSFSFQFYSDGVYDEPSCSSSQLDHGVLAVGYGTDKKTDYWLVKNSWGAGWGLDGYIKMSRNKNNQCGIATQASYPYVMIN